MALFAVEGFYFSAVLYKVCGLVVASLGGALTFHGERSTAVDN